ncbi:MAG: hypothetical protein IMW86_07395 [Hydrogenibacillus sp.]|nr:hypothetical protein [Hydrogenibacillus sp.]
MIRASDSAAKKEEGWVLPLVLMTVALVSLATLAALSQLIDRRERLILAWAEADLEALTKSAAAFVFAVPYAGDAPDEAPLVEHAAAGRRLESGAFAGTITLSSSGSGFRREREVFVSDALTLTLQMPKLPRLPLPDESIERIYTFKREYDPSAGRDQLSCWGRMNWSAFKAGDRCSQIDR